MAGFPITADLLNTVPADAQLDKPLKEIFDIANNPRRLKECFEFWKAAFQKLGEDIFEHKNTAGLQFANSVPNALFTELKDFKERNKLLITGTEPALQKIEEQFLVRSSGCLVSLEEITTFVFNNFKGTDSKADLFGDLKKLQTAVSEKKTGKDIVPLKRAIRYCRELHDLITRVQFCKLIEKDFRVKYYEVLALYRQEGALALTPAKDSYLHAPFIRTAKSTCRSPDVAVQLNDPTNPKKPLIGIEQGKNFSNDPTDAEVLAKKPGHNLVYATPLKDGNDTDFQFITIISNLLTTAGLDILFKNNVRSGDEFSQLILKGFDDDELFQGEFISTTRILELKNEVLRAFTTKLYMGLMLFVFENEVHQTKMIPSFSKITLKTNQIFVELYESHQMQKFANKVDSRFVNVCIAGNEKKPDTILCLRIQAMWYARRKFPHTLLAYKDRNSEFIEQAEFSPFVTYMRFHADDLIFSGILLRCLHGLKALKKFWDTYPLNGKFKGVLKFPVMEEKDVKTIAAILPVLKAIPDDSGANPLKTWTSLGLIEYYASMNMLPAWFKTSDLDTSSKDYKIRKTEAEIVLQMLTIIKKYNLIATLNIILEFTPIHEFFTAKVFEDGSKRLFFSKIFIKSHSFERLRLTYEKAHNKSL